jgi:5-methylcytosine-specific restriction protein A
MAAERVDGGGHGAVVQDGEEAITDLAVARSDRLQPRKEGKALQQPPAEIHRRRLHMPSAAPRPCTWPGCSALVHGHSRCEKHRKQADRSRGTAHQRGYTSAWTKARDAYLRLHPLCVHHQREGKFVAASVVDHVIPHRGDKVLFWDSGNWQSLCEPCHNRKTATEDGGFGR